MVWPCPCSLRCQFALSIEGQVFATAMLNAMCSGSSKCVVTTANQEVRVERLDAASVSVCAMYCVLCTVFCVPCAAGCACVISSMVLICVAGSAKEPYCVAVRALCEGL